VAQKPLGADCLPRNVPPQLDEIAIDVNMTGCEEEVVLPTLQSSSSKRKKQASRRGDGGAQNPPRLSALDQIARPRFAAIVSMLVEPGLARGFPRLDITLDWPSKKEAISRYRTCAHFSSPGRRGQMRLREGEKLAGRRGGEAARNDLEVVPEAADELVVIRSQDLAFLCILH
jgi:hypothetical protein